MSPGRSPHENMPLRNRSPTFTLFCQTVTGITLSFSLHPAGRTSYLIQGLTLSCIFVRSLAFVSLEVHLWSSLTSFPLSSRSVSPTYTMELHLAHTIPYTTFIVRQFMAEAGVNIFGWEVSATSSLYSRPQDLHSVYGIFYATCRSTVYIGKTERELWGKCQSTSEMNVKKEIPTNVYFGKRNTQKMTILRFWLKKLATDRPNGINAKDIVPQWHFCRTMQQYRKNVTTSYGDYLSDATP